MIGQIEAILFDMGGTLRNSSIPNSRTVTEQKVRSIMQLVGADGSAWDFAQTLASRGKAYLDWARKTMIELSEEELWTRWMLPELSASRISENAVQLNQLWRDATGTRSIFPETRNVILELFRRGYRLGIVSNTTSSVEVPAALSELHISGCFETVILSTMVGKRKPDPEILLEATRRMGIAPGKCAYIGDKVERDVAAARRAGFPMTVILRDPRREKPEKKTESHLVPDFVKTNLTDLLEIFPPRPTPQPSVTYDASLSTMWAIKNFPTLSDFFEAARRMGFNRIELNHKVTTPMLEGIHLEQRLISSVHEPCPADVSEDELKKRDWLISSINEANRAEGVRAIKRSIDLASHVGARAIVIHAGHTLPDHDKLEKKLRELLDAGQSDSSEIRSIRTRMREIRAGREAASFAAVRKSIQELVDYAAGSRICLGLENRFHYLEHPSPDELETLLNLADPERVGFLFDIGHAEALSRLGFYPRHEWLDRFAPRIIGVHLHDVIATADHYAAGLGSADFVTLAARMPEKAFRTCEFQNFNTPEQVKAGLEFLVKYDCIKKL